MLEFVQCVGLGGSYGYLYRLHGLLSDNILVLKVNTNSLIYLRKLKFVLGQLLTINTTHKSELYWVLRGDGSFVIVTEFKIRLIKSPSLVMSFSSIWYPQCHKISSPTVSIIVI